MQNECKITELERISLCKNINRYNNNENKKKKGE